MTGAEDKGKRFLTLVHQAQGLNASRFICAGRYQLKTKAAPYDKSLETGISSFSTSEKRYSDAGDVVACRQ